MQLRSKWPLDSCTTSDLIYLQLLYFAYKRVSCVTTLSNVQLKYRRAEKLLQQKSVMFSG